MDKIGTIYNYTTDWTGENYCGYKIKWNYEKGYVDLGMPGYVTKALKRLNYIPSTQPQYSPHHYTPFKISSKGQRQYAIPADQSPLLSPSETKYIQSIVGTFLYYARAVDPTILPAVNELAR